MMRAAIYARYSSDHQSSASIPDQVRLCRNLCTDEGWTIVEVFADEAISGATHLRPDFQRMQQGAMAGGFDVLVSESLDRLSRDQEHIAGLYKRLRFFGIRIVTKAEGEINELHIGLGGTMSAIFLRQLAEKTHRGLEGRVRAGKSAGGISYGYRVDRQLRPDGTMTTGQRVIDPGQAKVISGIFEAYARGESARSIAITLNRQGILPPRSGDGKRKASWSFSTISGNWKRGTGILNNELYIGKLVWNRQRFVKDPETAKRQARPNPPEAWIVEDVPDLRSIDDELWHRVKNRQGAIRTDILTERDRNPGAPRTERGRRARYLLSGLLHCGCCGSGYIMISADRYGCAAARNSGSCGNRKTIARKDAAARVLGGLKGRLMHPDVIREFIAELQRETQQGRLSALAERGENERSLAKVRREIDGVLTAIMDGMYYPSMKAKMNTLEAERARLEAALDARPEPEPVALHPGLAGIYADRVSNLSEALNREGTRAEAADLLRGLIEKVILHPDPDAVHGHRIELFRELGSILALCEGGSGTKGNARSVATGVRQVTLVAGAGLGLHRTRAVLKL